MITLMFTMSINLSSSICTASAISKRSHPFLTKHLAAKVWERIPLFFHFPHSLSFILSQISEQSITLSVMALSNKQSHQALIPSFLYRSSSSTTLEKMLSARLNGGFTQNATVKGVSAKKGLVIPSPSEPLGKIEMYLPSFYAACSGVAEAEIFALATARFQERLSFSKCNSTLKPRVLSSSSFSGACNPTIKLSLISNFSCNSLFFPYGSSSFRPFLLELDSTALSHRGLENCLAASRFPVRPTN